MISENSYSCSNLDRSLMSNKFQPINRDTPYLLPLSVQDWPPEKHLTRFIVNIVNQLDLNPLLTCYGGGGKRDG